MGVSGDNDKLLLSGYWGAPGNHLFVAPACLCQDKNVQKSKASAANKDFSTISHMMWDADMHKGKMRKLVSESRVIFLNVQKAVKETSITSKQSDSPSTNQLLKFSHQYMSSLKSTLCEIQGLLKFVKEEEERSTLENQLKMLEPFELLWGLCEVVLIDNTKGGYIVGQLMEWLRLRFYDSDLKVQKVIESQQGDKHELYWEAMYTFVLQGRIEEARRLLMLHSESRSESCQRIDLLLGHMPIYSPSSPRQSFTEWSMKWQQWHMTCLEHVEDGVFSGDNNLDLLCKILAGDESAFHELKHITGTWYCHLISKLFYQAPMTLTSELKHHTQACINAFGSETLTPWDNVVLSIFQLNIKQAIDECCSSFNNWWFVCHMTDLLEHVGCLEAKILPFGSTLREFVMIEYANSLISDSSLLEIGVDYLAHCSIFGRALVGELVLRCHLENDVKVRKMIKICERFELNEQAGIIYRERGLKELRRGQLGSALYHCIKSKDADFASLLVRKILMGSLKIQSLSEFDFINNFGSSLAFSNELAIFGKLAEYQRQVDQAVYNEAAKTLFILFSEKSSKRFWKFLFTKLVELLEFEELRLTRTQTTKFLKCLTEYDIFKGSADAKNTRTLSDEDLIKIRVYLAHNVATSFMNPQCEL